MKHCLRLLAIMLFGASAAFAQDIDSVSPACGAPGDRFVIKGEGFAEDPAVTLGTTALDVIKSSDTRILVRVPEDAVAGDTTVSVAGAAAAADFEVLAEGAPVVLWTSAAKGTAGMRVFLFGRRLQGAAVDLIDSGGATAATAEVVGGRRALYFTVPEDLAAGTYAVRVTNEDAIDSGSCSPALEIVEAGEPTLDAAEPEGQLPGQHVVFTGTNLGPLGIVKVVWTDGDGADTERYGFSNGFDTVWSRVPRTLDEGATYDVAIESKDGASTAPQGLLSYDVGTPPPLALTELEYDTGPAGSALAIFGTSLVSGRFELPTVEFLQGENATEAKVLFVAPGFGFGDDAIVVRVPDLADGDYLVQVTNGDMTSNTLAFTVADLPLAVTDMTPDTQGRRVRPILIEGTGFGSRNGDPLDVTFDDGTTVRDGRILFRSDRQLFVIPPGGWFDPLPVGEYTVRVVLNPDSATPESAQAGVYTVE